jgi:uncharacterized membrane protein YfcA
MDFDEMQVVWDEQKQQRVYALSLEALHASVKQRGRRIARGVEMMEIGMIALSIAMIGVFVAKWFVKDTSSQLLFTAAVLAAVTAYLVVGRVQRRSSERAFEASLLGDLDLAIAQLDYHIRRIRTFPLWFCAPMFATVVVGFASKYDGTPSWLWLPVLGAFPLSIYVTRLELRCMVPRRRELDLLRTKLANDG